MFKSKKVWGALGALVFILGLTAVSIYYYNLPDHLSQHETIILGQSQLVPGSQAAMRVAVRDSSDAAPLPDADVEAILKSPSGDEIVIYDGKTDENGGAELKFTVPDDENAEYTLIVNTKSRLGKDSIEQTVAISRDYRVLLSTDKPLYQPGQIIHLRALALSTFDLAPAAKMKMELIIADGKGNTIFRETQTTSDFGVAFTDFQLADQVNSGAYKITAILNGVSSEKTVTVERYVLPKFNISVETERPYYQPGALVNGTVDAAYFFGKAVSSAEITLEGFTFDFERQEVFTVQGTTDENGRFPFTFTLPDYIVGTDLDGGAGTFYLQAHVTDQTNHTQSEGLTFPVTDSSLIINAIPEGGQFRPGVENILYVLISYPDGRPAPAALEVSTNADTFTAETGEYGLAEIPFTPENSYQEVNITAVDPQGNRADQYFYFDSVYQEESVLLRPDRPAYQVGETMNLTLLTSAPSGTIYVDITREGQTVSTRAIKVENGRAEAAIDLTPDLFGTLELHAYKILRSGAMVRDTRIVLVDNADALAMTLTTDQETYRPGDTAVLNINVTDQEGAGAASAIGLAVVDEAVFALAEQDAGFAKLYFMLEEELLQPKYELHGFSVPDLIGGEPVSDPLLRQAQEGAAKASLAEAALMTTEHTLNVNSHDANMQIAYDQQGSYFTNLSKLLFWLLMLIPVAAIGFTLAAVWRSGSFFKKAGGTIALGLLSFVFMSGIFYLINEFFWYNDDPIAAVLVPIVLISFIILAIVARRKGDTALGWVIGLTLLFILLVIGMGVIDDMSGFHLSDMGAAAFALFLLPLAYLMRSAGFMFDRRWGTAVPALFVALGTLTIPLAGLVVQGGGMGMRGGDEMMLDGNGIVFEEMAMEMAVPTAADTAEKSLAQSGEAGSEPPRLRQYFPETMLWLPDGETDADGNLTIDVPVADSITTWRMTALASTQDGRLGSSTAPLRVFQEFFVDLDLPLALTVGDEVSIPVGVFNYQPNSQQVELTLQQESWFELLDDAQKTITIAPNEISVVYFRIKAVQFGAKPFQITAIGDTMSDAIVKQVQVYPDGKEIFFTESDRMDAETAVNTTIPIPAEAIAGTQNLTVKVYPGLASQVVEGLDSLFKMPSGCFEQTSSSTYPNVLALNYLQATGQIAPEVQFKAEEYINLGYQRLTTFEIGSKSGSFSLFGEPPADPMLTAYGLQEFFDMSQVYNVDPALITRIGYWLLSIQASDGSWSSSEGFRESQLTTQIKPIPVTAYVVWGLSDAGFAGEAGTQNGVRYLRGNMSSISDPYELALVANALVAYDEAKGSALHDSTRTALDKLADFAAITDGAARWETQDATVMGSYGDVGSIETTALATLAYLRSSYRMDLAQAGLNSLIASKDSFGNWHTTQTTILSLKAFITAAEKATENLDATVTVTLNNGQTRTVSINQSNFDVVQMVTFSDIALGDNVIDIHVEGEGKLMYQVTGSYYLPYDALDAHPDLLAEKELVEIAVSYDRTELAMNDAVTVDVMVKMNEAEGTADWALVDLGIPPGFTVNTEDLNALVARSSDMPADYVGTTIEKYELTGRQIIIYLGDLNGAEPFKFSYRMTAKYPLKAQTPASSAYDYYNPGVNGEERPLLLTVVNNE